MKKLLLFILILSSTYAISAEYELIHPKDVQDIKDCKYEVGYSEKKECTTKDKFDKWWRNACAISSAQAKSDFSAKKIYKSCLDRVGALDKEFESKN
ncbi:hypothetical protein [Candidatus Methylopumilus planktonicus]|uniref:hypothetical protein n=1 Tax=Candidatus Methylopumilus planktonicus TaxID=1581557 RepID=UPI003BEF03B0